MKNFYKTKDWVCNPEGSLSDQKCWEREIFENTQETESCDRDELILEDDGYLDSEEEVDNEKTSYSKKK